jgi:hypothetical protein
VAGKEEEWREKQLRISKVCLRKDRNPASLKDFITILLAKDGTFRYNSIVTELLKIKNSYDQGKFLLWLKLQKILLFCAFEG